MASEVHIKFDDTSRIQVSVAALKVAAQRVRAVQARQVQDAFKRGGQPGMPWPKLKTMVGTVKTKRRTKRYPSYRKGGHALNDTGLLKASFHSRVRGWGILGMESIISSSLPYAAYHQTGFKSAGPNFVPLTLHARRTHIKGHNPIQEGLIRGKDFIMLWKGMTVPARPMIDYANAENKQQIIQAALKGVS